MSTQTPIDDLYKGPLQEFVSQRTALAKTLSGEDAKRVKALPKPTLVPWAVNQLYWHERATYDRLTKAGEKLRAAQIAALKGKSADLQAAAAAHRKALSDAAAAATSLAESAKQHPAADALARMLEAVSLSERPPEEPGRFSKPLQPAGFEALTGVPLEPRSGPRLVPRAGPSEATARGTAQPKTAGQTARQSEKQRKAAERERARAEREREAAERKRREALKGAEVASLRARTDEARARKAWERAKAELQKAERTLEELRQSSTE